MSPFVTMWNNIISQHNAQNPNDQRQFVGAGSQGFAPMGGYMGQQSGMPNQQIDPETMRQYAAVLQRTGKLGGQGGMMNTIARGQNGRF